jgi:hypothetical protein
VLRGSGRTKQSVADSAFDAWTKYYRQDENAPNAIVSYYTKGSLVALALDLTIREKTRGANRSTTSCARCGSAMARLLCAGRLPAWRDRGRGAACSTRSRACGSALPR